jgi:transaldolase/glucose-6-phosphate isomerase
MTTDTDLTLLLPRDLDARVEDRLAALRQQDVVRRMWAGDPFVWTGADEDRWLGWLNLPAQAKLTEDQLKRFAHEIRREQISDVVLLGMGGSSLAPEVMQSILGRQGGYPALHVLDSTVPGQILSVQRRIDLNRTLFLVASKSGSTLEVNILKQHFYDLAVKKFGPAEAGRRFVLTTDPGSKLHHIAEQEHFREIFPGVPSVGGRYSALSNFGLVPAAAIGADVSRLIAGAEVMARRCGPDADTRRSGDVDRNPGLKLGIVLGELALNGRDKPTLLAPAALANFGAWMEQLIAESIGKQGKGIIPIEGETPGDPGVYGQDRVFIHLRCDETPDAGIDAHADALARAGQPVVRIEWPDRYALGAEFYRWEFATAVMGAVLGVNPFDQPDVEESKIVTRRLATEYEKTGRLPDTDPLLQAEGLALYADSKNQEALGGADTVAACIKAFMKQVHDGDYFALLAFIERNDEHREALHSIRMLVRDRLKVATCVGFGPRFLHSTGQAHKGGPNSGVFLQITGNDPEDLPVPGQRYSFGTIKLAQARGDFEVLSARGRRLIRVHLRDVATGLATLRTLIESALA